MIKKLIKDDFDYVSINIEFYKMYVRLKIKRYL